MQLLTVNECGSNPCRNGGTCVDQYNGFLCQCIAGWQGALCEQDVNECSTLAGTDLGCQNGATCINNAGSFRSLPSLLVQPFTFVHILMRRTVDLLQERCFHRILFLSRITQTIQQIFTNFGGKVEHGLSKKPSDFGGNPDHVTVRVGLQLGGTETIHWVSFTRRMIDSNNWRMYSL